MAIKDIQARLDKKVEEQAEKDFRDAIREARKILLPFFDAVKCTDYRGNGELDELIENFAKTTRVSKYGDMYLCEGMKVPSSYIRMKQAEASKEFIESVERLKTQMDDIQGQIDYMTEDS